MLLIKSIYNKRERKFEFDEVEQVEIVIRKYEEKDLCAMIEIWNEIVEDRKSVV